MQQSASDKLLEHVAGVCKNHEFESDNKEGQITEVVNWLKREYKKEYERKDGSKLRKQVHGTMSRLDLFEEDESPARSNEYNRKRPHSSLDKEAELITMEQTHTSRRSKSADATVDINANLNSAKKEKKEVTSATAAAVTAGMVAQRPTQRYSDLAGIESAIQELRDCVERPLLHPEPYRELNIDPPRGVLLHGPSGTGKTTLAHAIAGELGGEKKINFLKISAPEIVSSLSGESEQKLRTLFASARDLAPCIIFIDEIDVIAPKRDSAQKDMERRIVAQLLTCMDEVNSNSNRNKGELVMVIGATNRPDSLDPALRSACRFHKEIALGIPDEYARMRILKALTSGKKLSGDFDFLAIARACAGYVGADLCTLVTEAASIAVRRFFDSKLSQQQEQDDDEEEKVTATMGHQQTRERTKTERSLKTRKEMSDKLSAAPRFPVEEMAGLSITNADFEAATKVIQPSAKREGFATVPNVTWEDVGALTDIRDELTKSIVFPIAFPHLYHAVNLTEPAGVLLYGPPGCGKTLVAKAVAGMSRANFISIKGPELLNKYVGESERAVRLVFERGRQSSPCILFFDELDALCPRRGVGEGTNAASERVVNQLLTEMDGLEGRRQVYVIAATNRPDMIDKAMLRPGRLEKLLYVKLPDKDGRLHILKTLMKKVPASADLCLEDIAANAKMNGFSGADIAALVREASLCAITDHMPKTTEDLLLLQVVAHKKIEILLQPKHFDQAFTKVFPSVSQKDAKAYDALQMTMRN